MINKQSIEDLIVSYELNQKSANETSNTNNSTNSQSNKIISQMKQTQMKERKMKIYRLANFSYLLKK